MPLCAFVLQTLSDLSLSLNPGGQSSTSISNWMKLCLADTRFMLSFALWFGSPLMLILSVITVESEKQVLSQWLFPHLSA